MPPDHLPQLLSGTGPNPPEGDQSGVHMLDTDDVRPGVTAPSLTDREKMIVFLMGSGHSGPEIASIDRKSVV